MIRHSKILQDPGFSLSDWFRLRFMAGLMAPFLVHPNQDRVEVVADIARACTPEQLQELTSAVCRAVESWTPDHGGLTVLSELAQVASMTNALPAAPLLFQHVTDDTLWPRWEGGADDYLRRALGIETVVACLAGMAETSLAARADCFKLFRRHGGEFFRALLAPAAMMHDRENWLGYFGRVAAFSLDAPQRLALPEEEVAFDAPTGLRQSSPSLFDLREVMTRAAQIVGVHDFVHGIAEATERWEREDRVATYLARELRLVEIARDPFSANPNDVVVSADDGLLPIHDEDPAMPVPSLTVTASCVEEVLRSNIQLAMEACEYDLDMTDARVRP